CAPSARERNTSHHFAAKPQNIMVRKANCITCPQGKHHFFRTFGTQTSCLQGYATKNRLK
ncbi:MAG: hypothetical protein II192_09290, partial [Clostridia bacterium]|nr:hypothetical protein [Clostridia bacterium]